jgi:hypothetical protein
LLYKEKKAGEVLIDSKFVPNIHSENEENEAPVVVEYTSPKEKDPIKMAFSSMFKSMAP